MLISIHTPTRTLIVDALSDVAPPEAAQVAAAAFGEGWKAVIGGSVAGVSGRVFVIVRHPLGTLEWEETTGFTGGVFAEWTRIFQRLQYVEVEGEASTTLTTFQPAATLSFSVSEASTWMVSATAEYAMGGANRDVEVQGLLDGVLMGSVIERVNLGDRFRPFAASRRAQLVAGPHVLLVQYRSGHAGQSAKIRRVRCVAERVS
jgi:hypothetical protein